MYQSLILTLTDCLNLISAITFMTVCNNTLKYIVTLLVRRYAAVTCKCEWRSCCVYQWRHSVTIDSCMTAFEQNRKNYILVYFCFWQWIIIVIIFIYICLFWCNRLIKNFTAVRLFKTGLSNFDKPEDFWKNV